MASSSISLLFNISIHWNPRGVLMSTLSSLVAPHVVVMTTYGATSVDEVGIMLNRHQVISNKHVNSVVTLKCHMNHITRCGNFVVGKSAARWFLCYCRVRLFVAIMLPALSPWEDEPDVGYGTWRLAVARTSAITTLTRLISPEVSRRKTPPCLRREMHHLAWRRRIHSPRPPIPLPKSSVITRVSGGGDWRHYMM